MDTVCRSILLRKSCRVRLFSMELRILSKGKKFHRRVQTQWAGKIAGAPVLAEHCISYAGKERAGRGRLDILVSRIEDFVLVIEIKSTDWDAIAMTDAVHCFASIAGRCCNMCTSILSVTVSMSVRQFCIRNHPATRPVNSLSRNILQHIRCKRDGTSVRLPADKPGLLDRRVGVGRSVLYRRDLTRAYQMW